MSNVFDQLIESMEGKYFPCVFMDHYNHETMFAYDRDKAINEVASELPGRWQMARLLPDKLLFAELLYHASTKHRHFVGEGGAVTEIPRCHRDNDGRFFYWDDNQSPVFI